MNVEDKSQLLTSQPAHRIAVPLFLLTCIPYFGTLAYDYFSCCGQTDATFAWFGGFYLCLGGIYTTVKLIKRKG